MLILLTTIVLGGLTPVVSKILLPKEPVEEEYVATGKTSLNYDPQ